MNPGTKDLTIDSQNNIKITGNEAFTMTLAPASGLFSGKIYDTQEKVWPFKGAVLQKQNRAAGLFKGNDATGSVELDR